LTAWFGAFLLAGWILFGVSMGLVLKTTLTRERRQTLERRIDRMQDLIRRGAAENEQSQNDALKDFASATGNGLIEVLPANGILQGPAPSRAASAFPWPVTGFLTRERFLHLTSAGQPYSVLERPYSYRSRNVILLAAAPESGNDVVLSNFLRGLLATAPLLLLVSMAGGYWTSRRALRPVDRLTAAAKSIGIRNLSERLPVTPSGDELERLAETCNDMLDRLEIAVRKLKQFTADASHELRGPLSLTRTIAEVGLKNPNVDPHSRASLAEIVDESRHAEVLLEHMLELARADGEPLDIVLKPVPFQTLLEKQCEHARIVAQDKQIAVHYTSSPQKPPPVMGDPASLNRLIWILLDNAIKYTPPLGRIDVSLTLQAQTLVLAVQDSGVGITAAHLPRIFDRFYRADPSRSQVEGSGLGLSIAQWVAETHRTEIRVTSSVGVGSRFEVAFETSPHHPDQDRTHF
jgi:signal transduction histidine kinase